MSKRLVLLDVLKALVLGAITAFHVSEFMFHRNYEVHSWDAPVSHFFALFLARPLSLSGQYLVALTFFLFGLRRFSPRRLFFTGLFACAGQALLCLIFETLYWDVYAFVAVASFALALLPSRALASLVTITLSLIGLWVPHFFWSNLGGDGELWGLLIGAPPREGSWPLIPWLFLAVGAYAVGLNAAKIPAQLRRWEYVLWPLLLIASVPFLGRYYDLPVGSGFYQYVFNRPWPEFWAHFVFLVFLVRLAFVTEVDAWLSRRRGVRWLSRLTWVRRPGVAYFLSIALLGTFRDLQAPLAQTPLFFDLFFVAVPVATEALARLVDKFLLRKWLTERGP